MIRCLNPLRRQTSKSCFHQAQTTRRISRMLPATYTTMFPSSQSSNNSLLTTPHLGTSIDTLTKNTNFNTLYHHSKSKFSHVWGERTISWIKESIAKHMESHKEDYDFDLDGIPFYNTSSSGGGGNKSGKKSAIVTPCIKQATSAYLIDVLIDKGYHVTGVADPTANLKVIQTRFKIQDANVTSRKENDYDVNIIDHEGLKPSLFIEQRPLNTFVVKSNEWEHYDVVFDEMPLLDMATSDELGNDKKPLCDTTMFGHALRPGGLIYLQTGMLSINCIFFVCLFCLFVV